MIQFEAPFFLSFALLLPVLYILRRLGLLSQIAFPLTISDWGGASFEYKNPVATLSSVIAKIFSALSFLFLVVALANPIIRRQERTCHEIYLLEYRFSERRSPGHQSPV